MSRHEVEVNVAHVVGAGVVALAFGCEIHLAVAKQAEGQQFDADCWFRHPAGELAPETIRAIHAGGQIAEAAFLNGSPFDMVPEDAIEHAPSGCTLVDVAFVLDLLCRRWPPTRCAALGV